jgi:hypothetical protein
MIVNGKALLELIDTILKKEGFIKRKHTWYKHTEECICFFTIDKSPYGGYYDHATGFFIKELNASGQEYPVFYKCDLKIGLDQLTDRDLVKRAFDLENQEFASTEWEFILTELFELYVVPFLNDVSSKDGIRSAMNKHQDLIYYLNGDAREYLKL